jgi:hypothetical protein
MAEAKAAHLDAEGVRAELQEESSWKIDSTTIMTDVAADGVALTLTFTIDMSAAEMTPGSLDALKKKLAAAVFQRDAILQNLKAGAIYQYRFIDQDGKVLGQLNLTASDFT